MSAHHCSPGCNGTTSAVWDRVPGQERVVTDLRAMAERPVHAYLFVGPPGVGKEEAARSFAAALLCEEGGGCGTCCECTAALAGHHPDLVELQRTGAAISVDQAREVIALALRMPMQARRSVVILPDFHLVDEAAPALLKTIEEPPPTTTFVILADSVSPRLATVASRCVEVHFGPLSMEQVVAQLVAEGMEQTVAEQAASLPGGRLDRARRAAADGSVVVRYESWRSIPARLDGTGASVSVLAKELLDGIDGSVQALTARQEEELSTLAALGKEGRATPPKADVVQRHRRELRRVRTEELRYGLAALAGAYRDRLISVTRDAAADTAAAGGRGSRAAERGPRAAGDAAEAVHLVDEAVLALDRNPNESLLLQGLFVRLSGMV